MAFKTPPAPTLKPPLGETDHVIGAANAAIELVEYGDFECPHCGRAFVIVEQLRAEMGDKLRFAYRHFPLAKMHPHARKAAEASEAASAQGKFWEMHDLLYRNAENLEPADLVEYAGELGLDVERFTTELAIDTYASRVQEDTASGVRSGVNGTPTFFINGKRHNGGYDYESMAAALAG
jgi:protein-disulfide isomerase